MANLTMPRLGETVTEGTVVRWLKKEGQQVEPDEMIVEISTDKVDTEIPSPTGGVVQKILVPAGDKVEVGTELAVIGDGARAAPEAKLEPEPRKAEPEAKPAPAEERPRVLSPIVRKLAKEHGVDLSQVQGTGRDGRITKSDVMGLLEAGKPAGPEAPKPEAPKPRVEPGDRQEIRPLSHIRKMIAEHMVRSVKTSAHVTAVIEVNMEKIVNLRLAHKQEVKEREGFSLTYLPFVCRALIQTLDRWPTLNAELDGDDLVIKRYVNLGIAVAVPDGLIVPVIKGADDLNIIGLARAINDLSTRTRAGRLGPDEVHEGTFTITNPGSFGTTMQTPIINQPQVGILSLDAIVRRPVVFDSSIGIRHMANLSLSYDHRVNDGAIAAQFLSDLKGRLEAADFGDELLST
jgi:2-oxoglutarate dehydrogenase complex dihydrolipoamide succinyltransferase (E2) component